MRTILLCLIFVLIVVSAFSQKKNTNIFFCGYGENNNSAKLCDLLKSSENPNNKSAENAVDKILKPIGLPRNFVLVSCPKIQNAIAVTPSDGIRYIVFDEAFMKLIANSTSAWSNISILAHEIGHHLCGHTNVGAKDLPDQRRMELEADEFSGFVMYKLGANLDQACAAMKLIADSGDDSFSTHPTQKKRIAAITKGFNKAKGQQPIENVSKSETKSNDNNTKVDYSNHKSETTVKPKKKAIDTEKCNSLISDGEWKILQLKEIEAISDFNQALKINPNSARAYCGRGRCYLSLKMYENASSDFNQSISLDPEYPEPYFQRGLLKHVLGSHSAGCADIQKACDLGYDRNNPIKMCTNPPWSQYCK